METNVFQGRLRLHFHPGTERLSTKLERSRGVYPPENHWPGVHHLKIVGLLQVSSLHWKKRSCMYFKSSDESCDLLDPEDTVKSKSFDLLEKLLPEKQVPIPTPKEYSWILHRKELKDLSVLLSSPPPALLVPSSPGLTKMLL
nr:uncharacterized protein LOC101151917 isoform X5 [Gorilla gorilla gorilla]